MPAMIERLARTYPETWHIDDWDRPWLPLPCSLVNKIPQELVRRLVKLDEDSLLQRATSTTGLDDFGDSSFLEPLRLILQDLQAAVNISNLGRMAIRTILLPQLTARLGLEACLKETPHILDVPVTSPLIISGLPRTGTTHLHNLIAQVPLTRFIPLWQTLDPALPPGVRRDRRRSRTATRLAMTQYVLPLFRRMHEMEVDMPHEELTLNALSFRSFMFEAAFELPSYKQWYVEQQHDEGYRYLKKALQVLQYQNDHNEEDKKRRWVLKSPQHVDQLLTIHRIFPDAKIIRTHRDPVQAVISMITMVLYSTRLAYSSIDRTRLAKHWVDRLESMLRASEEQAAQLPADQVIDVDFEDFMLDQRETVMRVLEFAGIDADAPTRTALDTVLQQNARDKNGRIDYRFSDFDLDENEIRERFSFYSRQVSGSPSRQGSAFAGQE
jgi:hypothetical protein